jgi:hypothetical protein
MERGSGKEVLLTNARDRRTEKRFPYMSGWSVVDLLGWVGDAQLVQFSERGEEVKPSSCNLDLAYPLSAPNGSKFDFMGTSLGSCLNASWVLSLPRGFVAVVPGTGDAVTFIEESTLRVAALRTGRESDRESTPIVAWRDDEGLLVIVYDRPIAGSAVFIDLETQAIRRALGPSNDNYPAGAVCDLTRTRSDEGPLCVTRRADAHPLYSCAEP